MKMKFTKIKDNGHSWEKVRRFPDRMDIWINGLDLGLQSICRLADIEVRGIVQVGANLGQEIEEFPEHVPVLLLEPHPEIFPKLLDRIRQLPCIEAKNVAAGDTHGSIDFFLTPHHQQSSLRPLNLGRSEGTRKVAVEMVRLDSLLKDNARTRKYNILLIDTQGAEDVVLEGASAILETFDIVIMEMSYGFELYHGNADGHQLEKTMLDANFELVAVDPIEWAPCLLKDGAGYNATSLSMLLAFPRLWLFRKAQIASNLRDEFPFKSWVVQQLATCFSWRDRKRARKSFSSYLDHLELLGYQYGQRHTNAAFVRMPLAKK